MKAKCSLCGEDGNIRKEDVKNVFSDERVLSLLRRKRWLIKSDWEGTDTPMLYILSRIAEEDNEMGKILKDITTIEGCCDNVIEREIELLKIEDDGYGPYAGICC